MHWLCLHQLLLLLSFAGEYFCENVAVIGIMNELHTEPDCKKINPTSVKTVEAAYWLVDNINKYSVKNLTFEIDIRDICGNLTAVPAMMDLINKYKNSEKTLIGTIMRTTSKKAIDVTNFSNSLPSKYQTIQVGLQVTATELNNRKKYKSLFRVFPDDRLQMKMFCDVLVELKWNYIALLYEDDIYGKQAAELFIKCAKEVNIHIGAKLQININNLDILKYDLKKISGSVVIAQHATVKKFFEIDRFGRKMSFLMSETVSIYDGLFGIYINGAILVVQIASFENPKFQHYWSELFKQAPRNTKENSYFAKMIEEVSQCKFINANHSCDMDKAWKFVDSKTALSDTSEFMAVGIYALTSVFANIQENPCPLIDCPSIFERCVNAFHQPINLSFLKDKLGYERLNFKAPFDANGTFEYPPNWVLYKLLYRKKYKHSSKFEFVSAGNYTRSGLNLNTFTLYGYDMNNKEFPVEKVTCQKKNNCKRYQQTPDYIYRDGDIIFIGIVPIHDQHKSNVYSCGSIRMVSGVSLAEAMLFAVRKLNERHTYKYIFPGKKIGILILDSCDSEIIILRKLFAMRNNDSMICSKGLNCTHILNNAIVYIAALSSRVSQSVSKIMTPQHTVQISYGSTSDSLSNRNIYPNFMRVCTSDEQQVEAMIDLLVNFEWKYISIIYANELYGISFKDSFLDKSKLHDICVIRLLPYDDSSDVEKMLNSLRQRPEARVVILYLRSNQIKRFLNNFVKPIVEQEFFFLGSEAWANKIQLSEIVSKIQGSFTLALEIQENEEFNRYKNNTILKQNNNNIWLQNFIEKNCYMEMSLDKMSDKSCRQNYTLHEAGLKSVWIPMVIDAINAAALGLNKSISQMCNNGLVCPILFKKTNEVIKNLKNVKLKKTGGFFQVFDNNQDGTLNYNIYNIRSDGTYVKVGQWSKSNRITFNDRLQKPSFTTKCPNKKTLFRMHLSAFRRIHIQGKRKRLHGSSCNIHFAFTFVDCDYLCYYLQQGAAASEYNTSTWT